MAGEQVVIVTGAAGQLGSAVVDALAARPWRVVAVDRASPPAAEALAGAGTGRLVRAGADLEDPAASAALVEAVLAAHGRLDGVAHTVGGFAYARMGEAGPELFEAMFRLNLLTTLHVLRPALEAMRKAGRGSAVAVAAGGALRAPAGLAAYAASKAGVLRLVESFAEETKAAGVRVNAVLPSIIDTPRNRADMPKADPSTWVKPAEIARVIAFLLSDDASAVTGAAIPVTGRT
jgi:NAD(P)-dependent dehydrogenase (short-subunit alcohol dehydrogenase family)